MKKILLSIAVIATGFSAQSQVITAGVSPAAIAGNYVFEWADPGGGDWATPDFLIAGNFVQDTLAMMDDGSGPGTNLQGNPIAAEGCAGAPAAGSPAAATTVDLTGKIAVIYRNTCEFGYKASLAEAAGAVAVIIVNRDDEAIPMGGGAEGLNVTIPVVMLSSSSGATLVAEMLNGPVVMFIGNKVGAYGDDAGSNDSQLLISPYGGQHKDIFTGFDLGIQVYNFGLNAQNVTVTATIDGPAGNVYTESVGPLAMNSTDTAALFVGNPAGEFPPYVYDGTDPDGLYTVTYTIDIGMTDESDFDNVFSSTYTVNGTTIASSNVSGAASEPVATTYPSNSTSEYQSCVMFQEPNASALGIQGLYFVPHADTAVNDLEGAEIFINAYQWDDAWTDLDDPNFQFDPATNDAFQSLNLITFADYFPATNNETDQVQYTEFGTPFVLQDNVRYLFCLQTFNPEVVSFGYDGSMNYDGNQGIYRQPTSVIHVDGSWYTGGWSGTSGPSIGLNTFPAAELGLGKTEMLEGAAYPNPATGVVTVSVNANGVANLTVTDVAGRVAITNAITLVNGKTTVDIASLEAGVYIFNITMENGETSQFNVVKK